MIGLDTNILVRYLVQDDPAQSARATQIVEQTLSESNPGFVSLVAIAETAWVLQRSYGFDAGAIAAAIERLLQLDVLLLESEREVYTAMIALKQGRASFSDALVGALGSKAGCSYTITFDKNAARLDSFRSA